MVCANYIVHCIIVDSLIHISRQIKCIKPVYRLANQKKALLKSKAFSIENTTLLLACPQLTAQNFAYVGFREVVSKEDVFGRFIAR